MAEKSNLSSENQILELQPTLDRGVEHHIAGDLSKAEEIYNQILQVNPNQPVALQLLGVIAHQSGNNEKAVELINKALTHQPDYAEAHSNLGLALNELGEVEEAIANCQQAIAIRPEFPEAHINLAKILAESGRLEEAVASCEKALIFKPDSTEAHGTLEFVFQKLGKINDLFLLKNILSLSLPMLEIMDIGAMLEGVDRYAVIIRQGLGKVTGFEPNPESLANLEKRKGPYKYLPYFLGNGKEATFHITRYPGCSSLLEPNGNLIELFSTISTKPEREGNFEVIRTMNVETTRLDDIGGVEKPDYVKIDVQGAELMVLENAKNTFSNMLVIETEVEFVSIYKDQPLFPDIHQFLVQRGFILHKLIDIGGRSLRPIIMAPKVTEAMSQMLWADAIFIKDYTNLQAFEDEQLLKTSLILNDIYRSYDVVLYLLAEYDDRRGTELNIRYEKILQNTEVPKGLYMNLKEEH